MSEEPAGHDAWITFLTERFVDAMSQFEVRTLDWPHILICTDHNARHTWYLGPFDSATLALEAAEQEQRSLNEELTDTEIVVTVAPIEPLSDAAIAGWQLRARRGSSERESTGDIGHADA